MNTNNLVYRDSLKLSLKVVLLHNGNVVSSIKIAYETNMKKTYENMSFL